MEEIFKFVDPGMVLAVIPVLPLLGFLFNGLFGKSLGPRDSGMLATFMVVLAFVASVYVFGATFVVGDGVRTVTASLPWITAGGDGAAAWLNMSWSLTFDRLSAIMALVITGVGSLIHFYSVGYMSHDKAYWRYFAYLNLFCCAMLCLVLGSNMLIMFLGWEGVGLCSYLLIGFWYDDMEKAKAGKKAFVVNRIGDLGFLIGMFLIAWHFGSLDFEAINMAGPNALLSPVHSPMLTLACISLFVGACGKSAQIPLYIWLPDAMAGPTPVSALIHAATMVTAGVYMVCRMSPVFELAPLAMDIVAVTGGITALFAGTIALVQRDIKKVLAYSTVSQLGFMFMAAGVGAYTFAMFHLVTHAFFKALLFLCSGSVIHAMEAGYGHGNPESQDLRNMGNLRQKMPITHLTMMVGGIALAGIPPLAGFFSKDEILLYSLHKFPLVYVLGVCAAAMTAFYTARMLALAFYGKFRGTAHAWSKMHESPSTMTLPLVALSVLSLCGGFLNVPHTLYHGADHFAQFVEPAFKTTQAKRAETVIFENMDPVQRAGISAGTAGGQIQLLEAQFNADTIAYTPAEGLPDLAKLLSKDSEPAQKAAIAAAKHPSDGMAWGTMIASTILALLMFGAGFAYYKREDGLKRAEVMAAGSMKPVFNILLNKYWVDELFELIIVKPIRVTTRILFVFFDMVLVDVVFVNGSAFAVGGISHLLRRIQTGLVSSYLYLFAIGAALLLLYLVM